MKNLLLTLALLIGIGASSVSAQTTTHNHRLYIQNNSGTAIFNVYISSSTDRSWGMDMLGNDVIPYGRTQFATLIGHRWYDIKIVQSDDTTCTERLDLNGNKTIVVEPYSCYVSSTVTQTQY